GTHTTTASVAYSTADGSAIAGLDYIATNGSIAFGPNISTQTITVLVRGDTQIESNETFFVNLTNSFNAVIATGQGQGLGTIVNDDGLPGQLDHFALDPVPSPQYANAPFPVTITAQDASNATVTSFTGSVGLRPIPGSRVHTVYRLAS